MNSPASLVLEALRCPRAWVCSRARKCRSSQLTRSGLRAPLAVAPPLSYCMLASREAMRHKRRSGRGTRGQRPFVVGFPLCLRRLQLTQVSLARRGPDFCRRIRWWPRATSGAGCLCRTRREEPIGGTQYLTMCHAATRHAQRGRPGPRLRKLTRGHPGKATQDRSVAPEVCRRFCPSVAHPVDWGGRENDGASFDFTSDRG